MAEVAAARVDNRTGKIGRKFFGTVDFPLCFIRVQSTTISVVVLTSCRVFCLRVDVRILLSSTYQPAIGFLCEPQQWNIL
jgi:hypothetical protein